MVAVAHDWHQLPSTFGLCDPDEDFAVMAAYTRSQSQMQAYDHEQIRRKQEAKR